MRFGLYEALDCTPARLPPGENRVIVRSCMAHHQGMSLLALASVLLGQPMQRRFNAASVLAGGRIVATLFRRCSSSSSLTSSSSS